MRINIAVDPLSVLRPQTRLNISLEQSEEEENSERECVVPFLNSDSVCRGGLMRSALPRAPDPRRIRPYVKLRHCLQ